MIADIKGEIRGTAVVRDKDGNIKGHITFGGDATLEQFAAVKGIPLEEAAKQINVSQENPHGRDSDHSRS